MSRIYVCVENHYECCTKHKNQLYFFSCGGETNLFYWTICIKPVATKQGEERELQKVATVPEFPNMHTGTAVRPVREKK